MQLYTNREEKMICLDEKMLAQFQAWADEGREFITVRMLASVFNTTSNNLSTHLEDPGMPPFWNIHGKKALKRKIRYKPQDLICWYKSFRKHYEQVIPPPIS
jgi:hypothetical protein